MNPELRSHLERLARVPVLLVASDYDGTLAEIVEDPDAARPHRESMVALRMLAALPHTHVAVISGRAIRDLAALTRLPEAVHLVGSHGSEFDADFAERLTVEEQARLASVREALRRIAARNADLRLEEKPASVALHYRRAARDVARDARDAAAAWADSRGGVHVKHGREVVELTVVETDKGDALDRVRHAVGASAVLFLGDDITDEDAFGRLGGPDLGVKVGEGASRAAARVAAPDDVARVLIRLGEQRAQWLAGGDAAPIEDHALLSDQRATALVDPRGTVVWLCMPRLDSPPLFAALLGGAAAGRFAVRPLAADAEPVQAYRDDSMVLETRWPTLTVTDALDSAGVRPRTRPGRSDLIRVLRGSGTVEIEFAPRLDFGRVPTRLRAVENGLVVEDWIDPVVLHAPGVEWTVEREDRHDHARARVDLDACGELVLELRFGTRHLDAAPQPGARRIEATDQQWQRWVDGLTLPEAHRSHVRRSALVLKALCHGPTGAIAAAATTSLPETMGGVRNWDYRFCWPRDAAVAASSLVRLGSHDEAMRFLDWLLGIVEPMATPERLRPVYTVSGGEVPAEAEIAEVSGYAGSRPVRVGNLAANQVQLDIFGPITRLILELVRDHAPVSAEHWRLTEALVEAVARRWREPDHGIWEIRLPPRHHVHSRVMCWQTVRDAIEIAPAFLERPQPGWTALRDEIAADVLAHGFNEDVGAFTAAYGAEELDAATLLVGLSGLLPPTDPRFVSTVDAVERGLRDGPVVRRYVLDDGLPGEEGGWYLCAGWLAESLALIGERGRAAALVEAMLETVGAQGLLPEQYDPRAGLGLGNHPQAYSHVAVIDAVLRLEA